MNQDKNKVVCLLLLHLLVLISIAQCAKLPADVQKCHYEEPGCIAQTTNYILSRHFNGIPESNLNSLDPILVERVNIIQGPQSPVNINLVFKNLNIVGLRNAKIDSVQGFKKNFEGIVNEISATVPHLQLVGDYTINGKVLILPVQGEGRSNITMSNIRVNIKVKGRSVLAKGQTYLQADSVITSIEPGKLSINLENLYKGDKRLSDSTNLFLNENWQDIYRELQPSVEDTFAQVLTGVINNFFAKNKYHTLFLE